MLPFGAVFMFAEESVGKKDSGRRSRPDRVQIGAAECAAPHGLRNKALLCSDRSLIGALHVRDEYRAAVRRRICRTDVAADRLLSPVMSYHKSILNLYSGILIISCGRSRGTRSTDMSRAGARDLTSADRVVSVPILGLASDR
jgi:hypothetical protein